MLLALTGTGMSLAASSFLPQEYVSQSLELHICDKKMVNDLGSALALVHSFSIAVHEQEIQHCCESALGDQFCLRHGICSILCLGTVKVAEDCKWLV